MKRILCFGDSNTWGYAPEQLPLPRLSEDTRWTGVIQKKLGGGEWQVLEFGLCGCTSGFANEVHGINANARMLYPAMLFAPVIFQKGIESNAALGFDKSAIEKSVLCAKEVADLANSREVLLFDTNAVVHELCSDGCHFTVASHKAFAEAMADFIAVEQG